MPEPLVYLNGRITPLSQAHISLFDMGLVMGATVTEMVRTFHHTCYRLADHVDRLFRSLKGVGFEIEHTPGSLMELVNELVSINQRNINLRHELGVTIFVTGGQSLTYLGVSGKATHRTPTVCVHTFPLPFEMWAEKYTLGQHLVIPSTRQIPSECLDPKLKVRSRMHWYLADQEARLVDQQAMALLLDQQGNVTETSTGNIFIVRDQTLVTPPKSSTLAGVSQLVVSELASAIDMRYEERPFQPYDMWSASEAFLTSTPHCALPVTRLNGRPIGSGQPGPIYRRLLTAWSELVELDIAAQMTAGASERIAEFNAKQ